MNQTEDDSTATVSSNKILNESNIYSNNFSEWQSNFERGYWNAKRNNELLHINSDFLSSKKIFEKETSQRFCQKPFFTYEHKPTNKTHIRHLLCYSESKGGLFSFVCKVIDSDTNHSVRYTKDGFDNWKNTYNLLKIHDESNPHRKF